MDLVAINTASAKPPADPERVRAEKAAGQFEQLFVRSMISSLRATGSATGEGMFGKGPGADTFGDWFDQNLAEQITRTSKIGIAETLLADFERHGQLRAEAPARMREAQAAADRAALHATNAVGKGGIDVVLR
jgi:Rod binding domain-containing protein